MACNWFLVKEVESSVGPVTYKALRFGLAAIALALVFRKTIRGSPNYAQPALSLAFIVL